jgi:hypothetical protein
MLIAIASLLNSKAAYWQLVTTGYLAASASGTSRDRRAVFRYWNYRSGKCCICADHTYHQE